MRGHERDRGIVTSLLVGWVSYDLPYTFNPMASIMNFNRIPSAAEIQYMLPTESLPSESITHNHSQLLIAHHSE